MVSSDLTMAAAAVPGGAAAEPGAGAVEPGAAAAEPGAGAVEPGAGAVVPSAAAAEPRGPVRGSERGAATRSALLAAAREVFISEGYAQAAVTEIVARAGASVGCLYHHFTGKAELYLTLYDELQNDHAERTRRTVRRARDAGVTDPMQLFLAGARAYLDVGIEQRELCRVFSCGDGPPGFEVVWQRRLADWTARNTEFFAGVGEPLDEAVAIVMCGAMLIALAEMSRAEDSGQAHRIADGVLSVLSRLETRR
jgi:AcrR family transcriptional regulator